MSEIKKSAPHVERVNFKLDNDVTFESLLKRSFDAYKISGASEEWAAGFKAAVDWCKNIVDDFCSIKGGK